MRQKKKEREVHHCPHHGKELARRRGCQTGKWYWECPDANCKYKLEGKHATSKA